MRFIIFFTVFSFNAPRLVWAILLAFYKGHTIDVFTQAFVGKNQKLLKLKTFKVSNKALVNLDVWFHYLKGNVDIVGPKLLTLEESANLPSSLKVRFDVAPGMVCPFQLKRKSGIAYLNEAEVAADFSKKATTLKRIQVLLAFLIQFLIGNRSNKLYSFKTISLFGVSFRNVSMKNAVELILGMTNKQGVSQVSFVNADCVNKYINDDCYRGILKKCHAVFADGIGMRIAARWHKSRLIENVNGTDMFPFLCKELERQNKTVFLYGGTLKVLEGTLKRLNTNYPKLDIVGCLDGYSYGNNSNDVCIKINKCKPDILLVALGAPKQEKWIAENSKKLNVKVAIGVGGLFDFYSGDVSRAPSWLRDMSMEWIWRLLMQPKEKAKRYLLGNPLFLMRVFFSHSNQSQQGQILEVS